MDQKKETKLSKFISLLLRHKPETIGLYLDKNGWANVEELILKSSNKGSIFSKEDLIFVVKNCKKQRFTFNEDQTKIRANQGHSITIDLELENTIPPEKLYHGTAEKNLESIFKTGINKQNRNHVHLSGDIETAIKVGARHGKVVVLEINSGKMYKEGCQFYLSKNKVWLCHFVDFKYISIMKNED